MAVGFNPNRNADPANVKPPTHEHKPKAHHRATAAPPEDDRYAGRAHSVYSMLDTTA